MFTDRRILDLFEIELPILQAPMAGAAGLDLAVAVADGGGLGALPAEMLDADELKTQLASYRQKTSRSVNVNFFCHAPPAADRQAALAAASCSLL